MRFRTELLQVAAPVCASLLLAACGQNSGSFDGQPGDESSASKARQADLGQGWIASQSALSFESQRLVEYWDRNVVPAHYTAYRELVQSDGAGQFSIVPTSGVAGIEPDEDTFLLFMRNQDGFIWRYRDFEVRDANSFQANYAIDDLQTTEQIAGFTCDLFRARRLLDTSEYLLAIEPATQQVLRYEHFNTAGELLLRVTSETFDTSPDLTGAIWHQPSNQETLFPLNKLQQGNGPPMPAILPAGYSFADATSVRDTYGKEWLKLTYTDGLESLFFLHSMEETVQKTLSSGLEIEATRIKPPIPSRGEGLVRRMGAALLLQVELQSGYYMAIGRVSEEELKDMIESALP